MEHNILFVAIPSKSIDMNKDILLDPYVHGTLLRDLVGHDRKPAAFLIYFWLYAEQHRLATFRRKSRLLGRVWYSREGRNRGEYVQG